MKTVYIETYGCQMNVYDTEIVKAILRRSGYAISDSPENASTILLNTCSVRENAHRTVLRRIDALKILKRTNERMILGVIGCMAQCLKDELFENGLKTASASTL
jgi:tRNA-2-methylthio-N6-dimethylallyladenosine synthase